MHLFITIPLDIQIQLTPAQTFERDEIGCSTYSKDEFETSIKDGFNYKSMNGSNRTNSMFTVKSFDHWSIVSSS